MKLVVVTGRHNSKCASRTLVRQFVAGVEEAGHNAFLFDATEEMPAPCLGCGRCGQGKSDCVRKGGDGMSGLARELSEAEGVVFIVPLNDSGMPDDLKVAIDRIHFTHFRWKDGGRKTLLIFSTREADDIAAHTLTERYKRIVETLEWRDGGILEARGCTTRADIENSEYSAQARRMGLTFSE